MKLLLDENLPHPLRLEIVGHEIADPIRAYSTVRNTSASPNTTHATPIL